MTDSLQTILSLGVEVRTVLDVGVQSGTYSLKEVFPDIKHHLFEPMELYFKQIKDQYKTINYELHHVALSDADSDAWQIGISIDGSGKITHSYVSDCPVNQKEDPQIVVCTPVRMKKLDSLIKAIDIEVPYLLKIDVDGHEMPILRGAENSLINASVIVTEAPVSQMIERARYLLDKGFRLFDIVDPAYYFGILSQVDLVFIRGDIVMNNDNLRPWHTKPFSWDQWYPLNIKF